MFTTLAVVALAVSANAQGILNPASGTYYPDDAMNQGCITAVFDETVANPTATITVNSTAYTAEVEDLSFDSTIWRVNVADVMNGKAAGTKFNLSIGGLTGSYTWQPVFPLTGVTPAAGTELTSKTQKVVFTFSPAISYTGVRLTSGAEIREIAQSGNGVNTVTVAISDSDWGSPVGGVNNMTVALLGVTANGVSISNASGSEGTILANYTFAEEATDVTFLGVDPTEDEATAAELWDYWNVIFKFSDAVSLTDENVTAVITYHRANGAVLSQFTTEIATEEIYADWNYRGGYYGIEVPAPELPSNLPANFAYLKITLQGVAYNGTLLTEQPSATYAAELTSPLRKANKTAGISNSLQVQEGSGNIYNMQGVMIKSASNSDNVSLPTGMYIIDGKKVAIK